MTIKPNALQRHFDLPNRARERELANCFNDAFDITHAFYYRGLSVWLANGKPKVKARFGLDREVAVIYCGYPKTDARVLTTLDKAVAHDPKYENRVDRVIALLVHEGADEEAASVSSVLDWVIVPISAKALTESKDPNNLIRSLIHNRIGEVDLFGMNSAVMADAYFFGRDELVQNIISRGQVSYNNHGVFGLRRTGKTSVLWAIQRRLESRPVIAVYVDLHTPGNHGRRWWSLLQLIRDRCYEVARVKFGRDVPEGAVSDYKPETAAVIFSDDVQALFGRSADQVILLLDEVEWITPGLLGMLGRHWQQDYMPFWQTLRGVHQESKGRLSFVLAGVNSLCLDEPSFEGGPNPIFQAARMNLLEPFDRERVRQMIRGIGHYCGVKFDEEVYDYLIDHYGGHPYLTRLACSVIVHGQRSSGVRVVSVNEFAAMREEISSRLKKAIKEMLLSFVWFFSDEYDLLQSWANGDTSFVESYLQENPETISRLARWGIVRDGELAIPDMARYLRRYGDEYRQEFSPYRGSDVGLDILADEPNIKVLAELFEYRVKVESGLRRAISLYEGMEHGFDPARVAASVSSALVERRDGQDPRTFFLGRPVKDGLESLTLMEIGNIIERYWSRYQPLFGIGSSGRSAFQMNIRLVNKARSEEAHTKTVTEEELMNVRPAFTWFLERLKNLP
jgi:hypothetical protein